MRCEICGVEMQIERDTKFGHICLFCPNCSAKKQMEWIRVAKKSRSAYITAALHSLEKGENVYLSAVGGERIAKMFWCVHTIIVQGIAEIMNTTVRRLNGGAVEVGVVLHRRKVK
ncbi:MAG: hypothetical protein ACTSVR_03295 [Candidatus Thorarchaeota archaeon]